MEENWSYNHFGPHDDFRAIIEKAAREIDPNTAELICCHVDEFDPYDLGLDLHPLCHQIGKVIFARAPDSDILVLETDLPEETRDKLQEVIKSGRANFWLPKD